VLVVTLRAFRFSSSGTRRHAGFTLVELITVISIVAIIAAIAMPDLSNVLADQRLRASATDLMSSVLVARSEAIKRNAQVEVRPLVAGDWSKGWIVATSTTQEQLDKKNPLGPRVQVNLAPASIVYRYNGRLTSTSTAKLEFADSGAHPVSSRCLKIDSSGLPKLSLGVCS
jgi:type IV fimbrial biogenesis protein FimT